MKKVAPMMRGWEIIREPNFTLLIFSLLVVLIALPLGVAIGTLSLLYSAAFTSVIILAIILLLRLDELTAALIVAVHIIIDSYLSFDIYQIALLIALLLLIVCYFGRSDRRPWIGACSLWLWFLFLALNIYPTLNGGAFSLTNSIAFYLNLVLSAFIMFWLGNIISKNISAVRRVFQWLSVLATLIALHTIIEATTGKFLFESAQAEAIIAQYAHFQAEGAAGVSRFGSFLGNPDGNGIFLATSFFLPLGLFIESKVVWAKLFYLLEVLLILLGLMFTYSTGSWIAVLLGVVTLMFLAGRLRYNALLLILMAMLLMIVYVVFPSQVAAQLSHAKSESDLSNHLGTMQTALRVIEAFPMSGTGLGSQAYLVRAEPYRVPAQARPQAEPDNTFLQWGAMAGVPVMLVFFLLLGSVFWISWRNWRLMDTHYRPLLSGGIVALIALSINSFVVDGWTNPSGVEYLGWLIAGVVTSPLLAHCLRQPSGLQADRPAEILPVKTRTPSTSSAKRSRYYE